MPVRLLTQVEGFDQSLVSCEVTTLEVVKELTTAGNHLQKDRDGCGGLSG